jgi:hypothetical protein
MDRTAIHPHRPTVTRTGEAQAIRNLRTWSAPPGGHESSGLIRASFSLTQPTAAVTVWVQSRDGLDVLTYRHFTVARPTRDWEVTVPELPSGAYDVIVDVPDQPGGTHTSQSTQVDV